MSWCLMENSPYTRYCWGFNKLRWLFRIQRTISFLTRFLTNFFHKKNRAKPLNQWGPGYNYEFHFSDIVGTQPENIKMWGPSLKYQNVGTQSEISKRGTQSEISKRGDPVWNIKTWGPSLKYQNVGTQAEISKCGDPGWNIKMYGPSLK